MGESCVLNSENHACAKTTQAQVLFRETGSLAHRFPFPLPRYLGVPVTTAPSSVLKDILDKGSKSLRTVALPDCSTECLIYYSNLPLMETAVTVLRVEFLSLKCL